MSYKIVLKKDDIEINMRHDGKDIEYNDKRSAEEFKHSISGCLMISGYKVLVKGD